MAANLNDPDGLVNLRNLATEVSRIASDDKSVPIVLVPGFLGWGPPLFGAINYFGGVTDVPRRLVDEGYTVIVAPIAPISSNWERACELYRQLTEGEFSTVNPTTNALDEKYDLDVDYGAYFRANPHAGPEQTSIRGKRRAVLLSNSSDFDDWKWDQDHKVHFVCHSQGGNTVRYLVSLMANGAGNLHPEYFSEAGRDTWTMSVTTLGTPHLGTTIIDALRAFISVGIVGLVARLFATASFYPPNKRAYDLQLDHWGIRRNEGETFQDMLTRFESDDGPVWRWLNSNHNGLYDNSIEGVNDLSSKADKTSEHVFYFSLSFHATNQFPQAWPIWGRDAIGSFPTRVEDFVRTVVGGIPVLNWVVDTIANAFSSVGWRILMVVTPFPAFVEWITRAVITRVIQEFGYSLVLPIPGHYIPRKDVIPVLMPAVYAMGGQGLSHAQRKILGPNLGDWYQNDGVVNTESMKGPEGIVKEIRKLQDFNFSTGDKRGFYWHLGVNERMDHADEIGVFIDQDTADRMEEMYLNIARLITRLPVAQGG
ncbi:hypothetical protein ACJ41O_012297 [Fusarium nematophilum]